MEGKLATYARSGRRRIAGWFTRVDAEIFAAILCDQARRGVPGSPLEIGIHHGRSFIPLSLSATPEHPAIAVDLFEQQEANLADPSGRGDYARFRKNLQRFGRADCVEVITGSSLDLTPTRIGRRLRFVSVDGAHWLDAVASDLRLAANCAGPECVIAIDDFLNANFPEVLTATVEWLSAGPPFEPFAISAGKLYLCNPEFAGLYKTVLSDHAPLRHNIKKRASLLGHDVLVITELTDGMVGAAKRQAQSMAPATYERVRSAVRDFRARSAAARRLALDGAQPAPAAPEPMASSESE